MLQRLIRVWTDNDEEDGYDNDNTSSKTVLRMLVGADKRKEGRDKNAVPFPLNGCGDN